MKWDHFDRVNPTFKMLLSSWDFDTVFKKIRSFDAKNLGSVDWRATKLLAVKVEGLKKSLPPGPGPSRTSQPGINFDWVPIILKVWRMATLQPYNLQTL